MVSSGEGGDIAGQRRSIHKAWLHAIVAAVPSARHSMNMHLATPLQQACQPARPMYALSSLASKPNNDAPVGSSSQSTTSQSAVAKQALLSQQ
jgi:hypothetical protein